MAEAQVYESAEQFEELFGKLFTEVDEQDPGGMDPLVKKRMVIRFRVSEPDVDLWVDGRARPVETRFGSQELRPTLTASLSGNTLHELLLGTLPLGKAVSRRKLKVKGSMFKAMKLEGLFQACQSVYPELADEMLDDT